MKALAGILLLSSFSVFAIDIENHLSTPSKNKKEEICEDESKGSIVELTDDVIKADTSVNLKKLFKWFKQKEGKAGPHAQAIGEFRYVVDYPVQCEEPKSSEESFSQINCKGYKPINRESLLLKEGEKRSNNKFLSQVFSKKDGEIVRVEHVSAPSGYFGGREVFIVHKKLKNGDKVKYKIDPNMNAALNPIEILNETKGKLEASQPQYMGFGMNTSFGSGFQMW